jgi:hypothetical protein
MNHLTKLERDERGVLHATLSDGSQHAGVIAVRAFPVRAPDEAISILDGKGQEVCWMDDLQALPEPLQASVRQALQAREFMPEILRVEKVSTYATPSVWHVHTNRGKCEFTLKGEEDIRRLSTNTLIVADAHGVQFLIRDLPSLDAHSRKLLDRFL